MANRKATRIIALGAIVVAAGVGGYFLSRPEPAPPVVGVVRATEVRVAPEVGGQLEAIKVHKGDRVYVDTMLDNARVLARNVRVNTGVAAASALGQITRFDPRSGTLTLRDQIAAPVRFTAR